MATQDVYASERCGEHVMQQLVDDERLPSYRLVHDPMRGLWRLYAGDDELDALPDFDEDGSEPINISTVKRWATDVVAQRHGDTVTGWKRRIGTTVEYAAKLAGTARG